MATLKNSIITRGLRKTALLGGVLLVSMSIGGRSVLAAPPGPGPPGGHLNITEVFVDAPADGQIDIRGENFLFAGTLDVTLGDFGSLTIPVAATNTQIIANLPGGIPAGDYLLTVSTGTGQTQNDEYDLTIGGATTGTGYEQVTASTGNPGGLGSGSSFGVTVPCSAGNQVLGGGIRLTGQVNILETLRVFSSQPDPTNPLTAWRAEAIFIEPGPATANLVTIFAFAICAR